MGKRKHIIEQAENFLEKGIVWLEKKLDKDSSKRKVKKIKKERKKLLKQEVDYLYDDASPIERKAIVSIYHKQGIIPPLLAERKKELVTAIEFKQRMKELEEIQQEQTKELTR